MKTNFIKAWLLPSLTMALLSLAFVGCNTDEPAEEAAALSIVDEAVTIEAASGSKTTVNVDANCNWKAVVVPEDAEDWLRVSPTAGTGKKVVTFSAKKENDGAVRTATVTFTSTDGSVTDAVTVTQMGAEPYINVAQNDEDPSDDKLTLTNEVGDKRALQVKANVAWTGAKAEADTWYEVTVDGENVEFTVLSANETLEDRIGSYTITSEAVAEPIVVAIAQPACVPALEADAESVVFATTAADTKTFKLTAVGPWTLTAPEWATVTPTEGSTGEVEITVSVAANKGSKNEGSIVVTSTLTNEVTATVAVAQAGNEPNVTVVEAISVAAGEGEYDLTFAANYGWTIMSDVDWVEVSPKSGDAGEKTVKVTVAANVPSENNTGEARTGSISIICSHPTGDIAPVTVKVAVNQAEFDGFDLSAVETANCYIATTPSTYKFKATVRGNGESDQEMYIDVQDINVKVDGLEAIELWRDNQAEIATDITLDAETGYISFKINENAPKGNVVIALAILDEFDPTIISEVHWSWHIWFTNEDIEAKAMPITYPSHTTAPTVPVTMMDRNLGALIDGKGASTTATAYGQGGVQDSYGLHYEWGRKDPFPGCNEVYSPYRDMEMKSYLSSTRYDLYRTIDGEAVNVTSMFQGTSLEAVWSECINNGETPDETTTINYTINNPTVFITGGGRQNVYADVTGVDAEGNPITGAQNLPISWLFVPETLRNGSAYYSDWSWPTYLWGNSANGFTNYGQKTCYDPCPPGWRVPDANAFNFVIPSGWADVLYADKETNAVLKAINCTGNTTWTKANSGDNSFGASYVYEPAVSYEDWTDTKENQAYNDQFNAGYEIYTGGYQVGETMFFPMSGTLSFDSGNPCSDYTGWGSYASYALNCQNGYKQYVSRLEIYAPSGNITEDWEWKYHTKLHNFPGARGANNSSFQQAAGYSVRCMKDVAPEVEAE